LSSRALELLSDDDLHDVSNPSHQTVITPFRELFQRQMKRAMYEWECTELPDELNDGLRIHAPRTTLVDLNVREAPNAQ
jgi:hypothetical protein